MTVKVAVNLSINEEQKSVMVRPADTLLTTLREQLGLTGAKPGCENGDCGTCTVIIDGWPMKSCLILTIEGEGKNITTIEGLKDTPIQRAFEEKWGGSMRLLYIWIYHELPSTD